VLIAVGAQPNIELADGAGLSTGDGGVLVDASLRTSDPDIYRRGRHRRGRASTVR